jgi:hypothetical protein
MQESRSAMTLASNRKPLDSFAVKKDVQLVWLAQETADKPSLVSLQSDREEVLAIEWKVMANRPSTTRPEGKIVA